MAEIAGFGTLVHPDGLEWIEVPGGNALKVMRVSEETGVNILACTGIYTYDYLPHFFENRDVGAMADLFVSDIERGIQGTDAKAAQE